MNRRNFIQSLVAVFSLPANPILSIPSASAAVPGAMVVPVQARSWAVYISALHGECTAQTLQNLLHISEVDAKKYIIQLIADGIIKPNSLFQRSVTKLVKTQDDGFFDKAKKRLDMKARTELEEMENFDTADTTDCLGVDNDLLDDIREDERPANMTCAK